MKRRFKFGFTLAEVLITLGIIGVVATLVIPATVAYNKEKGWLTASSIFERQLGEALRSMNSQQLLRGQKTTENFVNELKKHMKTIHVCDNANLSECFPQSILWGSGDAEKKIVDMKNVKKASDFGLDWDSNVVGVQFANGIFSLFAYNPNCDADPYNLDSVKLAGSATSKFGAVKLGTNCIALLYDVSAVSEPNEQNKDIRNINVASLGDVKCAFELNGACFGQPFLISTPMTPSECAEEGSSLGISTCINRNDYWAGAVKKCGGVSKMASAANLAAIANYVYEIDSITSNTNKAALELNTKLAGELGLAGVNYNVWSNEMGESGKAKSRLFTDASTEYIQAPRSNSNYQAICLVD